MVSRRGGSDPVLLADVLDTRLGERQAGPGAAALLVEDRSDLTVTTMSGKPPDQIDCVLRGARALHATMHERDSKLGARTALPTDLDLRVARHLGHGHDDLADQRAQ